jgi:ketosteroid isomerase-like protein
MSHDGAGDGDSCVARRRSPGKREVKLSPGVVWTVRDGKIARFAVYADRAQALKAVGQEE